MGEANDTPSDEIIGWLLEEENPSVRHLALTKLLRRPESDAEVMRAKKRIMEEGIVPRVLALRNDEGYWGTKGEFYTDKYRGSVWQLLILAELGADGADPAIREACEYLLASSQDREGMGFSAYERAKGGGGLPSYVIPCLTGNMVFSMLHFGLGEDARIQAAVEWICEYQRFDDGDSEPPRGEPYDRYSMCWGRHSCHMGVVKSMKALSAIPPRARSEKARTALAAGAEYLLAHHIFKKSHDLSSISKPGWLKFGFPLMYQTDVLEILGILAELGVSDARMSEAVQVVREARDRDGRWSMRNSYNGKTLVDVEKKGKPSKWITLRALRALRACASFGAK